MTRDWHEQFRRWAKAPSETEEEKGARAAGMIRDAIRGSDRLAKYDGIDVYATGSYRNNTNVRLDSDIDLAVVLRDCIFFELPDRITVNDVGLSTTSCKHSYQDFRDDVGQALRDHFGWQTIQQGDKSYKIGQNSYRLNADVTPFLAHRRYTGTKRADGSWEYHEGVELRPRNDSNKRVINWHQHHYDNGVAKNTATGRRYKRVVRILKKLKQDMAESGSRDAKAAASAVPSFLIECLVYNAPKEKFNQSEGTYYGDVKNAVAWLFHETKLDSTKAGDLVEVSGLKTLFASTQPWTASHANAFTLEAWRHVGFNNG